MQTVVAASAVRCEAVILFAELRNFTVHSALLPAQRSLELVVEFFALARRVIDAHGGEVRETCNDTLMAVFCDGRPVRDAQHALNSAQGLLREFGALDEAWQREYGLRTAPAIGLHLGEIVFGVAGEGPLARLHALGDCVNVAHRLAHRARAGEIVLSDSVMGALAAENLQLEAEPLPALKIARSPPVKLYGVLLDTRLDFT